MSDAETEAAVPLPRTLVVEDDPTQAFLLATVLKQEEGFGDITVDIAPTLADALRMADQAMYELVVLDLGLPDATADQVFEVIPGLAAGRALVVLTGRDDEGAAAHALSLGAEDYLVKGDIEPTDIRRFLRHAVERTRRREREREMLARMAQLEHMATLGTTAGAIAHEINNPLAYAILALDQAGDLLSPLMTSKRDDPVEAAVSRIGVAIDGLQRIAEIVRDMLSFVRPSEAPLVRSNLREDVRWALDVARKKLDPAIALDVDLASTGLVEVRRGMLARVLLNLLLNVHHAFPPPVREGAKVVVASRDVEGAVELEVRDNGRGIEPARARRLFEPFYTASDQRGGTGLGLFVVRNLVSECGGDISLESEPGTGTTVRVRLPVAAAAELDGRRSESTRPGSS